MDFLASANATVHACPEGGDLAGQVVGLLLVGMLLGAVIGSVPIAVWLTRRDSERARLHIKPKLRMQLQHSDSLANLDAARRQPTRTRSRSERRRSSSEQRSFGSTGR